MDNNELLRRKVEKLLFDKYMDGYSFSEGYIPDLFDVNPLRDDIVDLITRECKV